MHPDRWRRIESLLDVALDLDVAERADFLERECADAPDLAAEVAAILAAGERSDSVLDTSAAKLGASLVPNDGPLSITHPQRVGPYRIERVIGEGGMGTVYLAQRDDGEFYQRVALKLVRRGLHLDARIVRRFRDERQMLAALNHPGIARLLDGGLTEDGLPFFAMEFVEGVAIDRYSASRDLSLEQRLELFAQVCDAVAHAHGKQIVHRDIKPSNILVTTSGEPRLLDFGIAKLLVLEDGADQQPITRRSERLLTPEYASPEQIRGEPVVIASDVYCLGVLLYELLTGKRPFRRAERSAHELERAVLEDDPTRPSDAVQREPLRRRLKGDLDAIILTAMNKETTRRYPSAAELAADVRRHMAGQPVVARGASQAYRLRRWARRHRIALGTAATVAMASTAAATVVLRASAPRRLVPGVAQRVPFEPEFALDAELSPDGQRLAFVAGTGTAMYLYVTDPGTARARQLGDSVPGFHRWPRWSPDGRRIVLSAGSRIYEVSADDGASRLMVAPDSAATYVAFPTWSPDGKELAYIQDNAILVRTIDGGQVRQLASTPNAPHSLRWSPDGKLIALVSGNTEFALGTYPWVSIANVGNAGPSSIWVVPSAGGPATRVTDGLSLNTSPAWMPTGRALLYVSNRDGSRDVYRVELDATGRGVGEAQRVTTGLGAHTISTSRGGRLAYSVFRVVANVWSVTAPREGERPVSEATPVTRGAQAVEGLALSADGQWLAFDSDRNGGHHIYTIPAGGGEVRQITTGAADEFMPHWSPNGSEIAYHAFTREAARRLQVVSSAGGAASGVTNAPRNQRRPGWSPDGRALVFDVGETASSGDIYIIEQTGAGGWGSPRRLTKNGGAARWSPDGREILYVRTDGIWATTREGGTGRQVLRVDPSAQPRLGNAEWSPDGKAIVFKRYDGEGRTSFWSVPAAGGEPRLLVRLDRELRSHRPEFATDGTRFFFTVTERVGDIWTMELREAR